MVDILILKSLGVLGPNSSFPILSVQPQAGGGILGGLLSGNSLLGFSFGSVGDGHAPIPTPTTPKKLANNKDDEEKEEEAKEKEPEKPDGDAKTGRTLPDTVVHWDDVQEHHKRYINWYVRDLSTQEVRK